MSFHVEIDLHEKAVLIIGAGNVALRKAQQCLQEGANVSVLAKNYLPTWATLPIKYIDQPYSCELLLQYDFIIAATNDQELQKRIIEDANQQHRLCMGVHQQDHASLHPMVSYDYDQFSIAVSSRGNYPAAAAYLAHKAGDYLDEQEHERLFVLSKIRTMITSCCKEDRRHGVARMLVKASLPQLLRLETMLTQKKAFLLCYHGVKRMEALQEVATFQEEVSQRLAMSCVESVYMSKAVCDCVNQQEQHIWFIDDLLYCLQSFDFMEITLQPMLFQKGHYYHMLQDFCNAHTVCKEPLWNKEEDVSNLIMSLHQGHQDVDAIVVRYHSVRNQKIHAMTSTLSNPIVYISFEKEATPILSSFVKRLLLIPMYILKGVHMSSDIDRDGALIQEFEQQGIQVFCSSGSAIVNPKIKEFILKKVCL